MLNRKNKLKELLKITKTAQQSPQSVPQVSDDSAFFITKELFLKNLKGLGDKDKAKIPSISV